MWQWRLHWLLKNRFWFWRTKRLFITLNRFIYSFFFFYLMETVVPFSKLTNHVRTSIPNAHHWALSLSGYWSFFFFVSFLCHVTFHCFWNNNDKVSIFFLFCWKDLLNRYTLSTWTLEVFFLGFDRISRV